MRLFLFTCCIVLNSSLLLAQDYNILSYGAKADCVTLNTAHIQSAINAAHDKGGGRVVIPAGSFLAGTIILKSNVELHLLKGAILLGSTDPKNYSKLNRWLALVMADGQSNVSITGQGIIDGQGRKLALHIDSLFYAGQIDSAMYNFVEMRPSHYIRPQLIEFVNCKNINIRNVTLIKASCWMRTYNQCVNVI